MKDFATKLLKHYDKQGRNLPWREDLSPYKVWLSEIMLQQTTVATVIPYFHKFLEAFPKLEDLANASQDEVYHLWQGLGYYSRARNLHKCAQVVATEYNGNFPNTEKELLALPGIGPYTAAAVAAIAFNEHATVVDGNVERVISRVFRIKEALPKSKPQIREKAEGLTCKNRSGDYAGAIMDLGATICKPKKPKCEECPVSSLCKSYNKDDVETFPRKEKKAKKKIEHGQVFVIQNTKGELFLQQRPDTGLLANLWEFPSCSWEKKDTLPANLKHLKEDAELVGQIRHIFTHIDLTLDVFKVQTDKKFDGYKAENLPPLSTLMKKVLAKIEA